MAQRKTKEELKELAKKSEMPNVKAIKAQCNSAQHMRCNEALSEMPNMKHRKARRKTKGV